MQLYVSSQTLETYLQERVDTATQVHRACTACMGAEELARSGRAGLTQTGHAAHVRARALADSCPGASAAVLLLVRTMERCNAPAPGGGRSRSWQVAAGTVAAQPAMHQHLGGEARQEPSMQTLPSKRGVKRVAPTPLGTSADAPAQQPRATGSVPAAQQAASGHAKRRRPETSMEAGVESSVQLGTTAGGTAAERDAGPAASQCSQWHEAMCGLLVAGTGAANAVSSTAACAWDAAAAALQHTARASTPTAPLALAAALARLELLAQGYSVVYGTRPPESASDGPSTSAPSAKLSGLAGACDLSHPLSTLARLAMSVPLTALDDCGETAQATASDLPSVNTLHLRMGTLQLQTPAAVATAAALQLMCLARRLGRIGAGARDPVDWVRAACKAHVGATWRMYATPRALFARSAAASASADTQAACIARVLSDLQAGVVGVCQSLRSDGPGDACEHTAQSARSTHDVLALACIACTHTCQLVAVLLGRVDSEVSAAQMPPPSFTPALKPRSLEPSRCVELPAASAGSSVTGRGDGVPCRTPPVLGHAAPRDTPGQAPSSAVPPPLPRPVVKPALLRAKEHLKDAEAHLVCCIATLAVRDNTSGYWRLGCGKHALAVCVTRSHALRQII